MGAGDLVRVHMVPRDVPSTVSSPQYTVNELPDHPTGMVIGSPGVVVVHVVMKESVSARASEKASTAKAGSKTGTMHNEAFPAAPGKKLFFGYRVVHATKPSGLLSGRRSKPVVAAAGTMQDGLSGTAEPKNALLTSVIPLDTLRLVLSCTPNNLIVLVENALLKRVGGTSR